MYENNQNRDETRPVIALLRELWTEDPVPL